MENFNAVQINESLYSQIQYSEEFMIGKGSLFQFKPPKTGRVVDEKDLFRTLYQYQDTHTRFKYINESPVCGYEMWIENGDIEFLFYTPTDILDQVYRKQLITIYEDCDIQPSEGKFIDIEMGDYVVGTEMALDNHYFEPVKTNKFNSNPYKVILAEIEKQTDLSAMIQFLYKPAEPDWSQLHTRDVIDQGDAVIERNSYESGFLGRKKEVDPSDEVRAEANKIKNQKNSKGFYMDIRLILASKNKETVEREATQILNLYQELFTAQSGQKLIPTKYESEEELEELLIDSIQRNPKYMRQPKAPKPYISHKLSENTKTLIMSIDELVSLAPIPYESGFSSIDGIDWADRPIPEATVGVGEDWTPLSEEEKVEKEEYLRGTIDSTDHTVKTPEGNPVKDYDPSESDIDSSDIDPSESSPADTIDETDSIDEETDQAQDDTQESETEAPQSKDPSDDDIDYEELLG